MGQEREGPRPGLRAPGCPGTSEVSLRSCEGSAGAHLRAQPAAPAAANPSEKVLFLIRKSKILVITAKKETNEGQRVSFQHVAAVTRAQRQHTGSHSSVLFAGRFMVAV